MTRGTGPSGITLLLSLHTAQSTYDCRCPGMAFDPQLKDDKKGEKDGEEKRRESDERDDTFSPPK
jgi:hypothetical protein